MGDVGESVGLFSSSHNKQTESDEEKNMTDSWPARAAKRLQIQTQRYCSVKGVSF